MQAEYPEEMVLLMHDGFVSTVQLDTKRLEEAIRNATGYDLKVSEKRIGEAEATTAGERRSKKGGGEG